MIFEKQSRIDNTLFSKIVLPRVNHLWNQKVSLFNSL